MGSWVKSPPPLSDEERATETILEAGLSKERQGQIQDVETAYHVEDRPKGRPC
jgi:hypothetical protein